MTDEEVAAGWLLVALGIRFAPADALCRLSAVMIVRDDQR
jgi:hypothetical protein